MQAVIVARIVVRIAFSVKRRLFPASRCDALAVRSVGRFLLLSGLANEGLELIVRITPYVPMTGLNGKSNSVCGCPRAQNNKMRL
jgi:hypothetical protein